MLCGKWVGVRKDGREEISWKSGTLQEGWGWTMWFWSRGPRVVMERNGGSSHILESLLVIEFEVLVGIYIPNFKCK